MPFELREYQRRSLATLDRFLQRAAVLGAAPAFEQTAGRAYRPVPQLPEVPYVCFRIPTGGGKTVMASHSVGQVAHTFLGRDYVICLWLVPSNTILDQTLARLRDVRDPYRQMLDAAFDGRVTVYSVDEAQNLRRSDADGSTVVIVSTLAAFRIEETAGRRVYDRNGYIADQFADLPAAVTAGLDRDPESGQVIPSLVNVLRLRKPIVIVDEAHNARTQLSFDTLARLSPSSILEFTATPVLQHNPMQGDFASNVLAHVSAAELKAEDMVKLPVRLRTLPIWKEAVAAALAKQRELEVIALAEQAETGEYLRPVVLFQAQSKSQNEERITVDALRQSLIDDFQIPEAHIARATGDVRELDDVEIADAACPIRFVITVQALREGWDCPSAYILCSVADMSSAGAVEQLLGRVLRMPKATRKQHDELNCAYAYAVSAHFAQTASTLRDALVDNGFQRLEASQFVRQDQADDQQHLFVDGLFAQTSGQVSAAPDLSQLDAEHRASVTYEPETKTLTVAGEMTRELKQALEQCVTTPADRAVIQQLYTRSRGGASSGAAPAAAEGPSTIVMPQLGVWVDGALDLFTDAYFLGRPWRLGTADARLSEQEFSVAAAADTGAGDIDVSEKGTLEITFRDKVAEQLSLVQGEPGWTVTRLAVWLDRQIPHRDLTQEDTTLFIHRALTDLTERRGLTLEQLALHKFRLVRALAAKIDSYRSVQASTSYQQALFGPDALPVVTSPELARVFDPTTPYGPNWYYEGPFRFPRHLYSLVGELKTEGEEFECAVFLEQHPLIARWVRNIEGRPETSFWLQTATDRFYPDFIGLLTDGRVFALEYKGEHLWSNDDSREKRAIGHLWATRSGGQALFAMPNGKDWAAIDDAFRTVGG